MHIVIMGLSLTEWGSVVAIITAIFAGIGLIVKMTSIMNRLESSITTLNPTLHDLISDNRDLKRQLNHLESQFDIHVGEAKVRNQRITALEKEVFNRDKN